MRGDGVRVLVVGAGLAGLSVARVLRDWRADVEVVDRLAAAPTEGTGIYLQGNAMRALESLGLARHVVGRSVDIAVQQTSDGRGRVLFEVPTSGLWAGVGPCVALRRSELHQILLDGADTPTQWDRAPEAVTVHGDGVDVTLAGRTHRYDLVIGADGIHSTVRRWVFGPGAVRAVGQRAHRFLVKDPVLPGSGTGSWSARLGADTALLTVPVGEGQLYCYVDGPIGDARQVTELLDGYSDPVPALLDALAGAGGERAVHSSVVEEVVLASWSRGGVLLVGDAAHATSPNMAQGAAMAFEDAVVLRQCLREATAVSAGLLTFERRRRPRTDWVRQQTHRRDRVRSLPPRVRDVLLRRFGAALMRANVRPLREPP